MSRTIAKTSLLASLVVLVCASLASAQLTLGKVGNLGGLQVNPGLLGGMKAAKSPGTLQIAPGAMPGPLNPMQPMIPPGGIQFKPNPAPGGGGGGGNGGGGGGNGGNGGGGNKNPDWVNIVGGVLGAMHHPGHHPGHYPNQYPGYWETTPSTTYYPPANPSPNVTVPSNPLPGNAIASGAGVVVTNPKDTGANVSFVVDGTRYTLQPGYRQTLARGQSIVIQYDRGGGLGVARYKLPPANYYFTVSPDGWKLFKKVFKITLDNSANANDFRVVVDGQSAMIAARQQRTFRGNQPLVVLFDRGDGQPARMTLDKGAFRIALNPSSGFWDLTDAQPAAAAQPVGLLND